MGFLAVVLLSVTTVFSQNKNRVVRWPEVPLNFGTMIRGDQHELLSQIDALEISDVTSGGKAITLGESFAADDEWLKSLSVRVKNVSSQTISSVQMNLFLPEIMPGGPMVTLCFGCGDVGKGQSIMPGAEVEMKLVLYDWLVGQINAKSSLPMITTAEIHDIIVTLADGRKLMSG